MDYCDIEWFALETSIDHSVIFEIAPRYCISDSFVDYEGYSFSSKGFLPTVVDIIVTCQRFYVSLSTILIDSCLYRANRVTFGLDDLKHEYDW